MNKLLFLLIIPIFSYGCATATLLDPAQGKLACDQEARYQVVFDAFWSAQSHPDPTIPSNPHFSPLIGGTHNELVQFWGPGLLASPGIENMAEEGQVSPLDGEVQAQVISGNAGQVIQGGGISPSPGQADAQFFISLAFRFVTLVSMIAPSPDWFVGIHDEDFCGPDGNWINELSFPLQPYDAGTDSGASFESPNADMEPQDPIEEITGMPFLVNGEVPPLGVFTFTRVEN